jgi:hypothetical protein
MKWPQLPKIVQRRDVLAGSIATLFLLVDLPFRWNCLGPQGLLDPHPPLFGLPVPFIWWGGTSSMEFTLSPIGLAIDLLVGTVVLSLLLGGLRRLFRPTWRLSRLSVACLASLSVVPVFQLLLLTTNLSWTPWPIAATPSTFQVGLSSYYLPR